MTHLQTPPPQPHPEGNDFWQGFNAASVALQQAAQSETAVYQAFSAQLVKLGLHGTVNFLDESGANLRVTSVVFSERLMRVIRSAEKALNVRAVGFTYATDASPIDAAVINEGKVFFLPDNSEKMRQVIPHNIYRFAKPFLKPFTSIPAILAPIYTNSQPTGVLYLAGSRLRAEDVPAIGAFASHLSIALENARLFQAVQQAETQYRTLFESASDGIFVFDPETRLILSANTKMEALIGLNKAELTSVHPADLVPPHIARQYNQQLKIALKQGKHFFDVPFVDRNGKLHHWQISTTTIELDGRSVLIGVVRDITKAKQAENALRQREEQFRVLAENVPGTIYLCKNEPNYPLLYINDGIETLTGHPKDEFIRGDRFVATLIHPEDLVKSGYGRPNIDIAPDEKFHFVYRVQHRSGVWRWAEDVGGGVFDENGELLFLEGVISDITERFESELLQKAVYRIAAEAHTNITLDELYQVIHENLAPVLDVTNFYIALYDEERNQIDVPYFVDKFDTLTGTYRAGTGLTEKVVYANRSQLLTRQQIENQIAAGTLFVRGTIPQVWLGVPLRLQGKAIGALVVQSYEAETAYSEQDRQFLTFASEQIANVVERKRAEEKRQLLSAELTQQTRLLEAVLAATPDGFMVFDLDGRFQFVSQSILGHLQVTHADMVGKTWRDLGLPESLGLLSEQDRTAVLETGQPKLREITYTSPIGEYELEFVTNPVWGSDGTVVSFVTTSRDVTEIKQTMRALHRAQKTESLGILAGGIAHDFNNLLVAMLGQASLAQALLPDTHPAYKHVGKAIQAAEQAANLTRQLLAYSGGGQFSVKPLQLNDLICESADLLKVALPKQVSLVLDLAPTLPAINGDSTQIQQVLMNLIINAAEAIGNQAGQIEVGTAVTTVTLEDHQFWRYTNEPLSEPKYIKLFVQDSGAGMDEETVSKIFDPFFTTKFTGRGLGLAAVLGIVRSHHGGLFVESNLGKGTRFELLFPASKAAAEQIVEELEMVQERKQALVLVIDDEHAVREAVVDILAMEGIEALTAANGNEGILVYQERQADIDLVLLDLSMPGKSGRETFEELQAIDPDVRIMLSSGYSEADATRGFSSPPLVGFLQKPYRLDMFVHRLHQVL
ncbi:MAG: PAS domain S-box protein [Anaerolineales bacterium]|nr:PAS domain S-box protein [Anaerolineales bacterium]